MDPNKTLNDLVSYKKPKGTGEGRGGFAKDYYDFLAANPKMSAEEATAFIQGTEPHPATSDNVKKHESHYLAIHGLVNRIANA